VSKRVGYLLHDFKAFIAAFFVAFFGVYALAVSRANAARHVGGYSVVEQDRKRKRKKSARAVLTRAVLTRRRRNQHAP